MGSSNVQTDMQSSHNVNGSKVDNSNLICSYLAAWRDFERSVLSGIDLAVKKVLLQAR